MAQLPNLPFLTIDFSPKGGGIDFLGLRWVNLTILGSQLLPGINNVTADAGAYCLGAWIPWKFRQLCITPEKFISSNYRVFREAIEVAISMTMRSNSPSNLKFGAPRNRIGVEQSISFPAALTFKNAKRTNQTSIYAAPLYGPSLRYLELIVGEAIAEDGSSTGF